MTEPQDMDLCEDTEGTRQNHRIWICVRRQKGQTKPQVMDLCEETERTAKPQVMELCEEAEGT